MAVTAVLEGQSPNYVDRQQVVVHVLHKGVELFVHGLGVEMGLLVDLELQKTKVTVGLSYRRKQDLTEL